jgi:hypothetical protein
MASRVTNRERPSVRNSDNRIIYSNSVTYSLLAGCAACQNEQWVSYASWLAYCPVSLVRNGRWGQTVEDLNYERLTVSPHRPSFPSIVPNATIIPPWALLQIPSGTFDVNSAEAAAHPCMFHSVFLRIDCALKTYHLNSLLITHINRRDNRNCLRRGPPPLRALSIRLHLPQIPTQTTSIRNAQLRIRILPR